VTARPASAVPDPRQRFLRQRRRLATRAAFTVSVVVLLGALLVAPNRLASVRVAGLDAAWWAATLVGLAALVVALRGLREPATAVAWRPSGSPAALALAAAWGSPAVWLGLPALVLLDGTRGLWPAATAAAGVVLGALLLGALPVTAEQPGAAPSGLLRRRWPASLGAARVVATAEWGTAVLFAWAQLAAAREIGAVLGWPRATVLVSAAVTLAAIVMLARGRRLRLAALVGGVAALAIALPLLVTVAAMGSAARGAWSTVASRTPLTFQAGDPWTTQGRPVRGPAAQVSLRFSEGQPVAFVTAGRVELSPWEGGTISRDVAPAEEIVLHPGDRLVVPQGMRLRFEAGRRIPDTPDSGPAWIDPSRRDGAGGALVGLGLTALVGFAALVPGLGAGSPGVPEGRRAVWTAALVVVTGIGLAVAWAVCAAWLSPQLYVGGVLGAEVYELPAAVAALGAIGPSFGRLALAGLGLGVVAALLVAAHGLAAPAGRSRPWHRLAAGVPVAAGAGLAVALPAGAWPVLVAALGLSASAVVPGAVLARWSERVTSRGLAAGALLGLATFAGLSLLHLAAPLAIKPGWRVLLEWPVLMAVPLHAGAAWVLRSRRALSPLGLSPAGAAPDGPREAPVG